MGGTGTRLNKMRRSACWLVVAGILLADSGVMAGKPEQLTVEDGDRAALKLATVVERSLNNPNGTQRVVLSESEVNAYLTFQVFSEFQDLITQAQIKMLGGGRLVAEAVASLEEVDLVGQSDALRPLHYLRGSVKVSARGSLNTDDGTGKLEVESVSVAGIPVPLVVLDELVRRYSRTDSLPTGFDIAEPFVLPYRIRDVLIQVGETVIVQ